MQRGDKGDKRSGIQWGWWRLRKRFATDALVCGVGIAQVAELVVPTRP
jgi:hypothetical protein